MFAYLPKVLLSGLLVSQVSGRSTLKPRDLSSHLFTRQIGNLNQPPQCQSTCAPLEDAEDRCSNAGMACFCTAATGGLFESCLDCVISVDPSQRMAAQEFLNSFTGSCLGFSVGSPTLSGSSPTAVASSTVSPISSVATSPSSAVVSSSSAAPSSSVSSFINVSSPLTSVTTSTPTTPATSSLPVIKSTFMTTSTPSVTIATTTSSSSATTISAADAASSSSPAPSSGASHLVAWNGLLGVGAGVMALALV